MLARRYLLPGKGEGFIFLVAAISLVAVALGVAALIIVMSVMNGFRAELFDKIVGLNGHAVIQGYDGRLANWQQIADRGQEDARACTSATPLIEQPLMASANGRVEGVLVRGNARRRHSCQQDDHRERHRRRPQDRSLRAATRSRSARGWPRRSAPIREPRSA